MSRHYQLLGPLTITENGRPTNLMSSPKRCALISYLIVNRQGESRETMANLLWDSAPTGKGLERFRTLLKRTRKLVPEMQVMRQTIRFQPMEDTAVDLYQLQHTLQISEENMLDITQLDKGLRLYQGDLLQAFYLEDAPRFNEWLVIERERLRRRVSEAYQRLCEMYAEGKQWQQGIEAAERWLTINDLDERPYRWLMRLHAANGNLSQAQEWYGRCCQTLMAEMGVDPDTETVALAEQLDTLVPIHNNVQQLTAADLVPDELPELGHLPTNARIPYRRNDDFVGRQSDLLAIAKQLFATHNDGLRLPVVAITGMGGLGKSQLAVEFAYRYGRYFPGGVYWISFADETAVPEAIAATGETPGMGLYENSSHLPLADRIGRVQQAWQQPINRLLIFDNCEDEQLLAEWLPTTGGCHILLTSRRAIWSRQLVSGQYPISPLHPEESGRLLQKLVTDLTEADALNIAEEVGHLPLALHLAGVFLERYQQITPSRYLAQLQDSNLLRHPSLQGHGTEYSPTGHELDVGRTIAVNFAQLDETDEVDKFALQLLAHAACFAPGEIIPRTLLAQTVLGTEPDILAELAVEDGLIRLLALGFLAPSGRTAVVMHRLIVTFVERMMGGMTAARTAVEMTIHTQLETDMLQNYDPYAIPFGTTHLRHLTQIALQRADILAAHLAAHLGYRLDLFGEAQEAQRLFLKALAIYENTVTDAEQYHTAKCFLMLGMSHAKMGCYPDMQAFFERALPIYEELLSAGDFRVMATHYLISHALLLRGDFEQAETTMARLAERHQNSPNFSMTGVATILDDSGLLALQRGDLEQALAMWQHSYQIRSQALGEQHPLTAVSQQNLGLAHMALNNLDQAKLHLDKAYAIRQQVVGRQHPHMGQSLYALGRWHLQTGDFLQAQQYLIEAATLQETVLHPEHAELGQTLVTLGMVLEQLEELSQASSTYRRAIIILGKNMVASHPDLQLAHERLAVLPGVSQRN